MKITIYELLGLIKDGKAPKIIKFCGNVYEWDKEIKFYLTQKRSYKVFLGGNKGDINILFNAFNENVEIIEEDEDIEKLKVNMFSPRCFVEQIEDKINELIDEVNKLKNK